MTRLKMGIIGVGGIAQGRHIPSFLDMKSKVEITAVHDVNQERAEETAKTYDISLVCNDYKEMFPHVDAVTICTPNKFHAEISIAALEAGVHVLCEKPMAITAAECEAMLEAAEKNDRLLSIAYHYRYTPEAQLAKKAILNNDIGEPLVTRVQAMRRRKVPGWGVFTNKDLQGGGSLIDFGCHLLDLALWLLDDPKPVEVIGRTYDRLSKTPGQVNDWGPFDHETFNVDDHVTSYITFENGASMQFECSWAANIKEDHTSLTISGVDGGLSVYPFELYQAKYGALMDSTAKIREGEPTPGLAQANNFVDSCLGQDELVVKPEQALKVTRLMEAIYQSSETSTSVKL
ncbi:Predicted dehydrogenase [Halobacillus karajensis]|uniref:Oxidoreductase YcjS n=1 Tax=Halobacillus karajensis TaxID=195088 RepID=A0A024P3R7_9BACI|nr:Gfo/Idh/MocA family oxidoreductase [Halobacillus karajensis]CDQ18869.1 putative oxidoreductase YcjS [Halobacillus karajensis]CDQ23058.1 putative oxidoreductase YcjS [Halobacillus karajensis]CDQ26540.1 putative oxidoreductase YcjS [Halobacillus karajensis]SEH44994.1 Predicted dehydrogenase [Halobacillus karajensis]